MMLSLMISRNRSTRSSKRFSPVLALPLISICLLVSCTPLLGNGKGGNSLSTPLLTERGGLARGAGESGANPKVMPKPLIYIAPPKIGLVLGGGGARGFAHVGVLRILEQAQVPIDLVVGTSVGALIGAMYAAERNTFELEWRSFQIGLDDLFDFSLFSAATGPVKGDAIQDFVRRNIKQKNIEEFKVPFVAVATDLNTGERVEFSAGSIVHAVRASVSIPGVFTPFKVDGRTLVDGGVVANLAVDVARNRGVDIVIASNITENVVNDNVEDVISIILQAINIMMGQMTISQAANADVVITPPIGNVGTLDFSQKKRCMMAGISTTQKQLPAIRAAIRKYYRERGGLIPAQFMEPVTAIIPSAPVP